MTALIIFFLFVQYLFLNLYLDTRYEFNAMLKDKETALHLKITRVFIMILPLITAVSLIIRKL